MKNINKLLLILLIVTIILLFLQWKCSKKVDSGKPETIPVATLEARRDTIILSNKHFQDSIQALLFKEREQHEFWKQSSDEMQKDYTRMADMLNDNLNSVTDEDCQEKAKKALLDLHDMRDLKDRRDNTLGTRINNLTVQVRKTEDALKQSQGSLQSMSSLLDSCLKNQTALDKYADKIEPAYNIIGGVRNTVYPVIGIAGKLGVQTPKGWMYEVEYQRIYGQAHYSFGVSKTIFKIKKRKK